MEINRKLLDAIKKVESGGDVDAIGDRHLSNKAYGPYQIRDPYYRDALAANPKLGGSFDNVKGIGSEAYSERVMRAYMGRYATRSRLGREPTDEDIARIHNGGPNGWKNANTEAYWKKVQKEM